MKSLELSIRKQLKAFTLQADLSLDRSDGNVLVLFGPSGSGKTITLKTIAGEINPDEGFINIGGKAVFDSAEQLNLRPQLRQAGYVPQNYALFPHLTVHQNIAFGLFGWDRERAARRMTKLLDLMQLHGLEKRYPRQLSGGQQQRVALARALAPEPTILLLDEPFSALDTNLRQELRQNVVMLSRDLGLPVIFVTHDLEEAYTLADRIAVYDQGQILQFSQREDVFYRPASERVARLIGLRNLFEGRVQSVENRLVAVRTNLFDLLVKIPELRPLPESGCLVTVCIRPERLSLQPESSPPISAYNNYSVRIVGEVARGSLYTIQVSLGQNSQPDLELEITAQGYDELKLNQQNSWRVEIAPNSVHLIY